MNDLETNRRQAAESRSERQSTQADQTGWYAFSTALTGIIVIMVVSLLCDWTEDQRLGPIVLIFSGCGMFALPIGMFSSWISRKCFTDTAFPPGLVAVVISVIGVLSIFGWGLVVASFS